MFFDPFILGVLLVVVAVGLAMGFAWSRYQASREESIIEQQRSTVAPPVTQPVASSEELEAEVLHLLTTQGKIQAIKFYREQTGIGLTEAKEAVEAIEANHPHNLRPGQQYETDFESPDDLEVEVLHILAAQGKIQAIKFYREQTGMGLKEAKETVEAIEAGRSPGIHPRQLSAPTFEVPEDLLRMVEQLLRERRKVSAVKLYREQTGIGLTEAKEAVEAIEARL